MIPPTRATDEELARARRADAQPGRAPRRPARPARREPDRRRAGRRAGRAARRASALLARHGRDPRLRRAPQPGGDRASSRTATYEATDVLEGGPDGDQDVELRVAAPIAGDEHAARLRRQRRPGRRQPQLPAAGDQVGRRSSRSACSPTPTPRPPPARTGRSRSRRPEGSVLNARPPAAVAAGNVETSSRVADLVLAALGRGDRRARAGPGNDEQLHPRRATDVHLLRDDRRRPGRLPGRRRSERASTSRCRTRSTRRSRRSRPSSRCGSRELRDPPRLRRRGAPATAATASCARSRRWSRCSFTLITERRRHRAARARAGGAAGAPGRNLLNGEAAAAESGRRARARRPAAARDARAAAATGRPRNFDHKLGISRPLLYIRDLQPVSDRPLRGEVSRAGQTHSTPLPRHKRIHAYCLQRMGRNGARPLRG